MSIEENKVLSHSPLMQLATGFWASKTLAAAHELDVFTRLSGSPGITSAGLAGALEIHERPAEMLLTGCAALGLLEKRDGRYHNSPLAEEFLVRGKPYYFGGMLQYLDKRQYLAWDKLTEAIRTNQPITWDPETKESVFAGEDALLQELFWEAMHSSSIFTARVFGEVVDFSPFQRLLDVGGGSGAFDIELCRRYHHLTATVYDLPFVVEVAAKKVQEARLSDRIQTVGGDFFSDPSLPGGHDVILLSLILHDWSEEKDIEILRKCYEALPSNGAVIISEIMVNDEKTGPAPAALMSLNMLVETEGRSYTSAEYINWLEKVGFRDMRTVSFEAAGANGAVLGYKP